VGREGLGRGGREIRSVIATIVAAGARTPADLRFFGVSQARRQNVWLLVEEEPVSWWSSDEPRRTAVVIAVVLAAAVVVGLGVGLLLGLAGGGGTVQVSATTPPAVSASPSGSSSSADPSPTTRAASEIERGTREDVGYFVGAHKESDGTHVTFDRALLKMGRDARAYARKYDKPPPGPDGVLLVNDNDLTRDLVLSPDVHVLGTRQLNGSAEPAEVSLDTLLEAVATRGEGILLDLGYDKLGYVVEVREHDLPS
jgi:hypothetical protein